MNSANNTNYVVNPYDNIITDKIKKQAEQDLKYFIDNPYMQSTHSCDSVDSNINIFVNTSVNSNGIVNLMEDLQKFLNKNIKIYLFKQDGLIEEFLTVNLTKDNTFKLTNILGHIKMSYYTGYRSKIEDYIKYNNIIDYSIYY